MSTRSSHQRCSIKKIFLKNFAIFTRKHLCWSLILIKAWRPATLWKRDFLQRYFSVNIAKSLITPILKCICKRMLLNHEIFLRSLRLAPQWHISLQLSRPLPNIIWDKVFRNGSSKVCGKQLLKNWKWSAEADHITLSFLKADRVATEKINWKSRTLQDFPGLFLIFQDICFINSRTFPGFFKKYL